MSANKPVEKKRSSYTRRTNYDLPTWADKNKFAYRWVNAKKISERDDGYDPRGWEKAVSPEGTHLRYKDSILAQMPIDEHSKLVADKAQAVKDQNEAVMGRIGEEVRALEHEVKKLGGKLKLNFTSE